MAKRSVVLIVAVYFIILCKFSMERLYYNIIPRARIIRLSPELEASSFLKQHIPTVCILYYIILYSVACTMYLYSDAIRNNKERKKMKNKIYTITYCLLSSISLIYKYIR